MSGGKSTGKQVVTFLLVLAGCAAAFFILPVLIMIFVILFTPTGKDISAVYTSPDGSYQVESVNISGGACDQGVSRIYVEYDDGKHTMAELGKRPYKKAFEIEGIYGSFGEEYDVSFDSDNVFTVTWETYSETHSVVVTMDGNNYHISGQ